MGKMGGETWGPAYRGSRDRRAKRGLDHEECLDLGAKIIWSVEEPVK